MADGRDSKEQSEFREYCRRWLAENRRGPRGSWATAGAGPSCAVSLSCPRPTPPFRRSGQARRSADLLASVYGWFTGGGRAARKWNASRTRVAWIHRGVATRLAHYKDAKRK
jgi:hypothetical protein